MSIEPKLISSFADTKSPRDNYSSHNDRLGLSLETKPNEMDKHNKADTSPSPQLEMSLRGDKSKTSTEVSSVDTMTSENAFKPGSEEKRTKDSEPVVLISLFANSLRRN